jgi:hypothetical protein
VKTFQIGNGITTLPATPMTIDHDVDLFVRVYTRVIETDEIHAHHL